VAHALNAIGLSAKVTIIFGVNPMVLVNISRVGFESAGTCSGFGNAVLVRRGSADSDQLADLVVAQGAGRVAVLRGASAQDTFDDSVGHGHSVGQGSPMGEGKG